MTFDTSLFQRVKVARASEEVVRQIEEAIFSSRLAAGDRLPSERELAEQFELSRMTVRDALRVLESNGLIEVKVGAGGGAFVRELNMDPFENSLTAMLRAKKATFLELAEARIVIETATAELAAKRATQEDLKALRTAVENSEAKLKSGDLQYMPDSVNFHLALAKACKNHILELTVNSFRGMFLSILQDFLPTRDMAEHAAKDHRAIFEAIKKRDPAGARAAMAKHLAYFRKRVQTVQDADG